MYVVRVNVLKNDTHVTKYDAIDDRSTEER